MTAGSLDAIAPGAASQLGNLLATMVVAGLMAGGVRGLLWLRRRRRGEAAPRPAPGRSGQPPLRAVLVRRYLGAVLALALALVTAPVIRQLWPHPDLGARLVVTWSLILLLPAAAWLLTRVGDRSGKPRS